MTRKSLSIHSDYYNVIRKLSGSQRDSILLALVNWASDMPIPTLDQSCEMLFDLMTDQIERLSKTNAENGAKGGAPRGNRNAVSETSETSEEEKNKRNKPTITVTKTVTKTKTKTDTSNSGVADTSDAVACQVSTPKATPSQTLDDTLSDFSEPMKEVITSWLDYKRERKESYKPTGLKAFLTQVKNKLNENNEATVISLVNDCMANGWKGIIWDKITQTAGAQKPFSALPGRKPTQNEQNNAFAAQWLEREERRDKTAASNLPDHDDYELQSAHGRQHHGAVVGYVQRLST